MPSLYQRVLGESFARLEPAMRRFHAAPEGATASGYLAVERGSNWAARMLASLAGMPPASAREDVELKVTVRGDREIWERQIGRSLVVTRQWDRDGRLMEAAGPIVFAFSLVVEEGGVMRFAQQRTWLLGVPMPRWLAPAALAHEWPTNDGWEVEVRLVFPLVGQVMRYHGRITPD